MDIPDIVTLVRLLFGILADAPKAWESFCKVVKAVSLWVTPKSSTPYLGQLLLRRALNLLVRHIEYRGKAWEYVS